MGRRVCVFGAGYVGLVTGACLASAGHDVRDRRGGPAQARGAARPASRRSTSRASTRSSSTRSTDGRLSFVHPDDLGTPEPFVFVAVGTPSTNGGAADLRFVRDVVERLAATADAGTDRRHEEHGPARHRRRAGRAARRARASPTCRIPSSCAKAARSRTGSTPTASSSAASPRPWTRVAALYDDIDAPIVRCDVVERRARQVRAQRVPRHEDLVHERDRGAVRPRRRRHRRPSRTRSGSTAASARRSSTRASATAGRASRRTRARSTSSRWSTATTSTCSRRSSTSTPASASCRSSRCGSTSATLDGPARRRPRASPSSRTPTTRARRRRPTSSSSSRSTAPTVTALRPRGRAPPTASSAAQCASLEEARRGSERGRRRDRVAGVRRGGLGGARAPRWRRARSSSTAATASTPRDPGGGRATTSASGGETSALRTRPRGRAPPGSSAARSARSSHTDQFSM